MSALRVVDSRIVTWGGLVFAPIVTVWFRTLERVPIKGRWPATIARVGLDQFVFAPFILTGECHSVVSQMQCLCSSEVDPVGATTGGTMADSKHSGFFTAMTLMEGKDMKAVKEKWNSVRRKVVRRIQ